MTEEFKQSLIDSIIQQRGFTPDDRITQDLLALVSESNDQLFIAKVYNELALYDKVQAQMSDDKINFENLGRAAMGQGAANPTLSTFNRALDNSVDTPSWRTGNTPAEQELAKDIYRGLDVAAGIKGPEGSEAASNYYDYLNTKLDQVIEDTGFLGVVIRPPRGEGGTIYVTEDLNEWFINNPPMAMLEGFYPSEGKSYRKYPGFAKPTILTKPAMTKNDETGYYEHTGDYLYAAESFNADGKFNTEQDIGDTFNVAVGSVKPDGTSIGDVQTLSYDELQLLEAEVALDPTKQIVHTSGNKDEAEQQLKAWLEINNLNAQAPEYDIFGGITPDYAIYKQPDLADAFIDGDPTAAEMKDAMLPQQIYAGSIPEEQFYGGTDHISGQGVGLNNTQKISWISLAPQEIKAIQTDLMQAGYLDPESYFLEQGAWQDKTSGAMFSAMVDANLNMIDVYSQISAEKERYFKKPPLTPKVYQTPSPGFIKDQIDAALKSAGVTRKLTDAELVAFSDFYIQADKDYETANAEYQKNLDLANRLFPGAATEIQIPSTAREELEAYAEQQFEPQLQAQQRGIQERNDLSYLFSSIDQFDRMIGG
jgi:hypothetical protein